MWATLIIGYGVDLSSCELHCWTDPIMHRSHIPKYTLLQQKGTHFCSKRVHCGVFVWCVVGFMRWYNRCQEGLYIKALFWVRCHSVYIWCVYHIFLATGEYNWYNRAGGNFIRAVTPVEERLSILQTPLINQIHLVFNREINSLINFSSSCLVANRAKCQALLLFNMEPHGDLCVTVDGCFQGPVSI